MSLRVVGHDWELHSASRSSDAAPPSAASLSRLGECEQMFHKVRMLLGWGEKQMKYALRGAARIKSVIS